MAELPYDASVSWIWQGHWLHSFYITIVSPLPSNSLVNVVSGAQTIAVRFKVPMPMAHEPQPDDFSSIARNALIQINVCEALSSIRHCDFHLECRVMLGASSWLSTTVGPRQIESTSWVQFARQNIVSALPYPCCMKSILHIERMPTSLAPRVVLNELGCPRVTMESSFSSHDCPDTVFKHPRTRAAV